MSRRIELPAAQVELVGLHVAGRRLADRLLLAGQEPDLERRDDAADDLVLHREHVGEHPVVALGPQVPAGGRVDQLRRDPDPLAGPAHAALQDVAGAQPGAGLAASSTAPLRAKVAWRAATNRPETLARSVIRSSAMPSAKCSWSGSRLVFANGSTATDGRSGGAGARGRRGGRGAQHDPVHPHRPLDVLEPELAEGVEAAVELAAKWS